MKSDDKSRNHFNQNTIKQLLETYGSQQKYWPLEFSKLIPNIIKNNEPLHKEYKQQQELDNLFDRAAKHYQQQISDKAIARSTQAILARVEQCQPCTDKDVSKQAANRYRQLGAGILLSISASLLLLIFIGLKPIPQADIQNPEIVQRWLSSELNPELLDSPAELPVSDDHSLSDFELISEDI